MAPNRSQSPNTRATSPCALMVSNEPPSSRIRFSAVAVRPVGVTRLTARYTEVYKGGNALRFGGALLGGAVNLVTPTGRTATAENLSLGASIVTIGTAASIGTATIANTMISTVTTSLTNVTAALSRLGTKSKAFETHLTFVSKLQDSLEVGVGNLVDADLAKESAKFQALQTKQQLGVQALSIANQSSQSILSLFR